MQRSKPIVSRKIRIAGPKRRKWFDGPTTRHLRTAAMKLCTFVFCVLAPTFLPAAGKCPIGAVQGITRDGCYLYSSSPLTWFKAQEQCMSRNGHLASVSNGLINAFLQEPANSVCAQEYWLGGSYDVEYQSMWTWTDGSRFSYTHWAHGECQSKKRAKASGMAFMTAKTP